MATYGAVFNEILKISKTGYKYINILELFEHVCSNVPVLLGSHRILCHTVALAAKKGLATSFRLPAYNRYEYRTWFMVL